MDYTVRLASRFPLPRNTTRSTLVRWPRSWPRYRAAYGGNARDEEDEPSRKGERRTACPSACGWQSRATSLAFLLTASLMAQGFDWSPALAATCEIPAVARQTIACPRRQAPPLRRRPLTPRSSRSKVRPNQRRRPPSPPVATPVQPAADPAELLAEELTAVAESLAACLSTGDAETVTQLAAERYLGQLFGSSVPFSRDEYVAIASELTPIPVRSSVWRRSPHLAMTAQRLWSPRSSATGSCAPNGPSNRLHVASAAGESRLAAGQKRQLRVSLRAVRRRSMSRSAIARSPWMTTVSGPDVVLSGFNVSDEDHEMLVLRLAPGYTTVDLLRASGPDLPEEATCIGTATVTAGDEGDLVLVDLEPGEYTLVCLFPDPEDTASGAGDGGDLHGRVMRPCPPFPRLLCSVHSLSRWWLRLHPILRAFRTMRLQASRAIGSA